MKVAGSSQLVVAGESWWLQLHTSWDAWSWSHQCRCCRLRVWARCKSLWGPRQASGGGLCHRTTGQGYWHLCSLDKELFQLFLDQRGVGWRKASRRQNRNDLHEWEKERGVERPLCQGQGCLKNGSAATRSELSRPHSPSQHKAHISPSGSFSCEWNEDACLPSGNGGLGTLSHKMQPAG